MKNVKTGMGLGFGLTVRVADHHQAAQHSGEGQSQEGGVRVAIPPQELREEEEERR